MRGALQATQQAGLDADGGDHGARRRRQHRAQVEKAEQGQEADRDPGAEVFHPGRHLPAVRSQPDAQCDGHDDGAVAQREQRAAPARAGRRMPEVVARQAVDGGEMVRVEPVLGAEDEDQGEEGEPVGRQVHIRNKRYEQKLIPHTLPESGVKEKPLCEVQRP
jgi:hypothetical protein